MSLFLEGGIKSRMHTYREEVVMLSGDRDVVQNNREVKGVGKSHCSSDVPDVSGTKKVCVVDTVYQRSETTKECSINYQT